MNKNKIVERLERLSENWYMHRHLLRHRNLNKCYGAETILMLNDSDFERFIRSNCFYLDVIDYKEEVKMIFGDKNEVQPSVENVQLHMDEVKKHKDNVSRFMQIMANDVTKKAVEHDDSKLGDVEVQYYAYYTPELSKLTYGSQEYKDNLDKMRPAIDHHYAKNDHHPEHFEKGIEDMTLVNLIEMMCDWKAATMRHNDGNMLKSMEMNKKRFNIDDQLYAILMNTIKKYLE
jgi:hypothetical protein